MVAKISNAEFPLMEYIWDNAPLSAKALGIYAAHEFEWNKNTTYTVLKRLCERGILKRSEFGFIVTPMTTREEAQRAETDELIDKVYQGSMKLFLMSFSQREDVSDAELSELEKLINDKKKKDG